MGFFLSSFGFFRRRRFSRFFLRDKEQVVTGHPCTRTCVAGSFSLFVPPLLSVSPVLAVRPASWWFFGVPFWAPGVFGILLELTGLELTRPFRGPFLGTRGGKGFPVLLLPCFSFSPFVMFCGYTFSRKARPVISRRPAAGDRARPLARVRARGAPRARRVGPLLVMFLSCFLCLVLGRRDPGALRQEPFVCRGCPFRVAPWALTRTFCSPPQVFFFYWALGAPRPNWSA